MIKKLKLNNDILATPISMPLLLILTPIYWAWIFIMFITKFLTKKFKQFAYPQLIIAISIVLLLLLSACASSYDDPGLPSPCVGGDKSPCVRRPVNQMLT
ncbi:hypothetical protein CAXC1_220014 [Candidatus Xenohaliotis californiensis]|uniref:Uncharacterized protein n=1 Tax=Candidatus Xenohaliotis californiensis TaxID=84677 RepID=A0ABP0ESD6_9RICK|nr:hypothetical protein CAXC1_220014 [Candidatus Xenohaliotis californiensis]